MDENENQIIEATMDGVISTVASEQKMNGWIVAGVAAGSTIVGGLLTWAVPKLINKIKTAHAAKKSVKNIVEEHAEADDEDDNK